jgi:hypothetical protein
MNASFTYAIANNLVGFKTQSLRVRVARVMSPSQVEVCTADLTNSGTWLVLHPNQLVALDC